MYYPRKIFRFHCSLKYFIYPHELGFSINYLPQSILNSSMKSPIYPMRIYVYEYLQQEMNIPFINF